MAMLSLDKVLVILALAKIQHVFAYLPASSPKKLYNVRRSFKSKALILPYRGYGSGPIHALQVKDTLQNDVAFPLSVLDKCWSSSSATANPDKDTRIDNILQGLISPAPQSFFVLERALKMASAEDVAHTCGFLFKVGYTLIVRESKGDIFDPGQDWNITPEDSSLPKGWCSISSDSECESTLRRAAGILSHVTDASDYQTLVDENMIRTAVRLLETQFDLNLGTDLRGRAATDTAYTLALSGVVSDKLYEKLYRVSRLEMDRLSGRSSQRSTDLLHIVEKIATSGARPDSIDVSNLYKAVSCKLLERNLHLEMAEELSGSTFDLLKPRPLLWLWRVSSRTSKPFVRSDKPLHQEFPEFEEKENPLVVDLGCGFGVSLLGLCRDRCDESTILLNGSAWSNCNFLGGDLNQATIRFASGIAKRWGLADRLKYLWMSTETLLDEIDAKYHGPVALILLQFPTPYRLEGEPVGNQQLPNENRGFMASHRVIEKIVCILKKSNGKLLIQSNCEDVAMRLRDVAVAAGLRCVPFETNMTLENLNTGMTERTKRWIRLSNSSERATGVDWSAIPVLPSSTETDVACKIQNTPVHRCLLELKAIPIIYKSDN